jgi:hypothetical protein
MTTREEPFVSLPDAAGLQPAAESFAELTQRTAFRPAGSNDAGAARAPSAGVTVAQFRGFDLLERPLVVYPVAGADHVLPARSTIKLSHAARGASVLVVHENGEPDKPIIIGIVEANPRMGDAPAPAVLQAEIDGERHVIRAEREIVLQCGDASITLTRAGKVIIRGHDILSRSTGCNRIKGATVDIN